MTTTKMEEAKQKEQTKKREREGKNEDEDARGSKTCDCSKLEQGAGKRAS